MANTKVGFIYRDNRDRRRLHGIFAPGLDRFIFIDNSDVWVTLETAEILSSKLPTMAYVLHTIKFDFGNHNCLEFAITNKTNQTVQTVSIVNRRQTPCLMFAPYDTNPVEHVGPNPDYNSPEKVAMLARLQEYAQFVNDVVYVCRVTDAMANWMDTQTFLDKYVPDSLMQSTDGPMTGMYDRSTVERGVFFQIRHALYISDTIEEAEQRIIEIWKTCHHEQEFLMSIFYRHLDKEIPAELVAVKDFKPVTISTSLL